MPSNGTPKIGPKVIIIILNPLKSPTFPSLDISEINVTYMPFHPIAHAPEKIESMTIRYSILIKNIKNKNDIADKNIMKDSITALFLLNNFSFKRSHIILPITAPMKTHARSISPDINEKPLYFAKTTKYVNNVCCPSDSEMELKLTYIRSLFFFIDHNCLMYGSLVFL